MQVSFVGDGSSFNFDDYHDLDVIYSHLDEIVKQNPQVEAFDVSKVSKTFLLFPLLRKRR